MKTFEHEPFFGTATLFSIIGAFTVWAAIIGLIAAI
jgi:hypothetical protein